MLFKFFQSTEWAMLPSAMEPLEAMIRCANPDIAIPSTTISSTTIPSAGFSSSDTHSAGTHRLQDGVAIIEVSGLIHRNAGGFSYFLWTGQDAIKVAIKNAMQDPEAKALLLSFDSPGGVAAGVKELADFIASQTAKPIYSYADGLCASAAYWLAAATGRVYAPVSATIGSIGVINVHCDRSVANTAQGLRYTYITGGVWKATGNSDTPLSSSDQTHIQERITALHEIFRADVSRSMPVDASNPSLWGEGQVFLGAQAKELGLITDIVADRDALVAHIIKINKEIPMNKEELAKTHPDLLAQIQAEAIASANAEIETKSNNLIEQNKSEMLGIVRAVAGDETSTRIETLISAGLSVNQIAAFSTVFGNLEVQAVGNVTPAASSTESTNQEQGSRQEILQAVRSATPSPLAMDTSSNNPQQADEIEAAVNRMSQL